MTYAEAKAAPWLLELCHANGCTCTEIDVAFGWMVDGDGLDPIPGYWWHNERCPFATEIELTIRVAGVEPDDTHPVAYAVVQALNADTLEAVESQRRSWQHLAHGLPRAVALANALLDWRAHHLAQRDAS